MSEQPEMRRILDLNDPDVLSLVAKSDEYLSSLVLLGLLCCCVGSSLLQLSDEQVAAGLRPDQSKALLVHGLMVVTLLAVIAIPFCRRR